MSIPFFERFAEVLTRDIDKFQAIDKWDAGNLEGLFGSLEVWLVYGAILMFALMLVVGWTRTINWLSRRLFVPTVIIWLAGVVVYVVGFYHKDLNFISVVPRAIISSFKMFVVSNDLARVAKDLHTDATYMAIFAVTHFCAAFLSFVFILKIIGFKLRSHIKIVIHKWFGSGHKQVHLFWGINEASQLLAKSINSHSPHDTIIFVDIDEEKENQANKFSFSQVSNTMTITNSDIAFFDGIGALVDHCYNGPSSIKDEGVDVFNYLNLRSIGSIVKSASKLNFYLFSADEAQNIAGALALQKDSKLCAIKDSKGQTPTIYIHARRNSSNEVFDHYSQYETEESNRMKVKIIDSSYISVAALKDDDRALPINSVDYDTNTGIVHSDFNSLIIGFGHTGQEYFKFLYEFGAFIGPDKKKSPFKCYVIDEEMDKISGLIRTQMPEIEVDELTLIKASVNSKLFWDQMATIMADLNYVVISLNEDTLGLSVAVNLFKYALRYRSKDKKRLKIMLRCYHRNNENRMSEVVDNLNNSTPDATVELRLFGKQSDIYTYQTILSDEVLMRAKEFHRVYSGATDAEAQWRKDFVDGAIERCMEKRKISRYQAIYEVNRCVSQNVANALHLRTKLLLMGLGNQTSIESLKRYMDYADTRKDQTPDYGCDATAAELLRNVAMVEHERWNAAHRLMGYVYAPVKNFERREHDCLRAWDELTLCYQSYDCEVVETTIKLAYQNALSERQNN